MSKHAEQLRYNSDQVGEAERRLAIQRTYIERLRASGANTRSAEETLEVMRDIPRGLHYSRSLLRRRAVNRRATKDLPTVKRATKRAAVEHKKAPAGKLAPMGMPGVPRPSS